MTRQEITELVAQAWCTDKNEHKVMDVDLAEAIVDNLCLCPEYNYIIHKNGKTYPTMTYTIEGNTIIFHDEQGKKHLINGDWSVSEL